MVATPEVLFPFSGPAATVLRSFLAAKGNAEVERQADAQHRLDVYEDDWADALQDRIRNAFTAENAAELEKVLDTTNNPLKRIVNEISTLYHKPPVWKFAEKSTQDTWRRIQDGANAPVFFPELNRMVTLLNDVLVYVCPYRDHLTYRLILPQDAYVVPDPNDPARPLEVMFREGNVSSPSQAPVWHYWSRSGAVAMYEKYDNEGRPLAKPLAVPYRDEFGAPAIPIVAYHRKMPTWSFWDSTGGDDLYELTVMVGLWETWINHLLRTDAIRQKWASGEVVEIPGEQQGGPTAILQFRASGGGPINIGEFSSQADWSGLGNQLTRKLENVLNNYGLATSDFRTSGDPTSGFALRVRKEGLVELREQQIPVYRTWDKALYAITASVWNFEITNPAHPDLDGDPLPPPSEAKPDIQYAMYQTAQTVEEQAAAFALAKERMSLGLESPITIYLADHPGETEEEARAAIEKNRADSRDDSAEEVDPTTALNGAQVASLLEIVRAVAAEEIPRETGIEMIVASFPVDRATAERLMGPTGQSFFAKEEPEPAPAAQPNGEKPMPTDEKPPMPMEATGDE